MKIFSALLFAIASLLVIPEARAADTLEKSGNAYLEKCGPTAPEVGKLVCWVYVLGFVNGLAADAAASEHKNICVPLEAQSGQLSDVIISYLQSHPDRRHWPTYVLAYIAFRESYACPVAQK